MDFPCQNKTYNYLCLQEAIALFYQIVLILKVVVMENQLAEIEKNIGILSVASARLNLESLSEADDKLIQQHLKEAISLLQAYAIYNPVNDEE